MAKPIFCPFCGSNDVTVIGSRLWYTECDVCGARSPQCGSREAAIASWNTRYERTCRDVCEWYDENGVFQSDARLFKCSECGYKADDFYGDDEANFPRYCPNCGAKVVDRTVERRQRAND